MKSDWRNQVRTGRGGVPLVEIIHEKRPIRKIRSPNLCKALECRICFKRYSNNDIIKGLLNLETYICSECYASWQQKPHIESCFGKPTFLLLDGTKLFGFNPKANECANVCPDRLVCRRIVRPDLVV